MDSSRTSGGSCAPARATPADAALFSHAAGRHHRAARELLHEPALINVERPSAPAVASHPPIRSAPELKLRCLSSYLGPARVRNALRLQPRTKHRANRLADGLARRGVTPSDPRQSFARAADQGPRGFKAGNDAILVATDIDARASTSPGSARRELRRAHRARRLYPPFGRTRARRGRRRRDHVRLARRGMRLPRDRARRRPPDPAGHAARLRLHGAQHRASGGSAAQRIAEIRARKSDERARARRNAERSGVTVAPPAAGRLITHQRWDPKLRPVA